MGKDDEARSVVHRLHGADADAAQAEYAEMYETIKAESLIRSRRLSDLWATPAMVRRTLVAVGVQVFTQFTGINGNVIFSLRGSCNLISPSFLCAEIKWYVWFLFSDTRKQTVNLFRSTTSVLRHVSFLLSSILSSS